jgi:alkylation response protein AidB-like acyl-CoA dehydrogenase
VRRRADQRWPEIAVEAAQRAIACRGLRVVLAESETAIKDERPGPATGAAATGAAGNGGWHLHGSKTLVCGAAQARLLLVSARVGDGVPLFAVDPQAPGVELRCYSTVDAGDAADIALDAPAWPVDAQQC